MDFDPTPVITEFCEIHGIPCNPPSPEPGATAFQYGRTLHAWLREQCHQFEVTYPFDYPYESAMTDYQELQRQHRANLRAQALQEADQLVTEINRTIRHRDRQEEPPSPTPDSLPLSMPMGESTVTQRGSGGEEAIPATTTNLPAASTNHPPTTSEVPDKYHTSDTSDPEFESGVDTYPHFSCCTGPCQPTTICTATTSAGTPCRRRSSRGGHYCFPHHPATAEHARRAARRGGQVRPQRPHLTALLDFNLATFAGIQAANDFLFRLALVGAIPPERVNPMNRLLNSAARNVAAGRTVSMNYDHYREQLVKHLTAIEEANALTDYHQAEARRAGFLTTIQGYYQTASEFDKTPPRPNRPSRPPIPH